MWGVAEAQSTAKTLYVKNIIEQKGPLHFVFWNPPIEYRQIACLSSKILAKFLTSTWLLGLWALEIWYHICKGCPASLNSTNLHVKIRLIFAPSINHPCTPSLSCKILLNRKPFYCPKIQKNLKVVKGKIFLTICCCRACSMAAIVVELTVGIVDGCCCC